MRTHSMKGWDNAFLVDEYFEEILLGSALDYYQFNVQLLQQYAYQ
jgi:hypothetical protein